MNVKIAHAVYDEHGKAQGGAAGDQTGKEVCRWSWYDKPWTSIIRPKKRSVAKKIAQAMEDICDNNNVGYDQGQRTTLYSLAKSLNWDFSKIMTKCECDCSSLVAVCVNAAGIKVSKDMYTGNEAKLLMDTGAFELVDETYKYKKPLYLQRGDILLGKGHTAVVLNDGSRLTREIEYTNGKYMVGSDVEAVQEALTDAKYPCGSIDGEYGRKTAAAVVRFQKDHGLTPDSIVGPKTVKALGLYFV